MAVISVSDGQAWLVARWVFAWVLQQAIAASTGDERLQFLLQQAIALDGLHFDMLSGEEAAKLRDILNIVTARAVRGELPRVEVNGRVLDERSQVQFRSAAAELLRMLKREEA